MTSRRSFLTTSSLAALTGCQFSSAPQTVPNAPTGPFMLGIDMLASRGFDLLRGRRVGLITNHTAYTSQGVMSRVAMQRALGAGLVALYGPEHGIDGTVGAGKHIATLRDPVTGLIVHSLYGPTRKPTPKQLAGIDTLVFDVQDIGCRSYTYISTMVVAMEAAAEQGKSFVVLDRPNPMGGWRVEGPPVESRWKSFVSQIPVPYVHGMTVGELAMMTTAHGWIVHAPRLTVVKMQGWNRSMTWRETGLRWHATSPNIPHATSPFYYVATGILGGAAAVDVGIGSENPFGYAGGSGVSPEAMLEACQSFGASGVSFSPYSRNGFGGVRLSIQPQAQADLTGLDIMMLGTLNHLTGGRALSRMSSDKINLFNKVFGSEHLLHGLRRGESPAHMMQSWQGYTQSFRRSRHSHLLYS